MEFILEFIINLMASFNDFICEQFLTHFSAYGAWNKVIDVVTYFLTLDVFNYPGVNSVVTSVHEAIKPPAYALTIFFWMYGILKVENTVAEMKRPESVVRHFIRLGIAVWLIDFSPDLVKGIWNIGLAIASDVNDTNLGHINVDIISHAINFISGVGQDVTGIYISNDMTDPAQVALDAMRSGGSLLKLATLPFTFASLGLAILITDIAVRIAILKCGYNIFTQVVGRFFRIVLLIFVGPLAVSTASAEDTQRVVFQYIKNVCAVSIEVGIITLLLRAFTAVGSKIIADPIFITNLRDGLLALLNFDANLVLTSIYNINTIFYSIASYLLFLLCIFTLQASIKGVNSIIDSLFGLRGV